MERGGLGVWGLTPWREVSPGDSGLSLSVTHLFPWEFFHLNLCFFLTNKIKFVLALKEALKRLYFLLVEGREELVIVSPHLPKPQPKLVGLRESAVVYKRYWSFSSLIP